MHLLYALFIFQLFRIKICCKEQMVQFVLKFTLFRSKYNNNKKRTAFTITNKNCVNKRMGYFWALFFCGSMFLCCMNLYVYIIQNELSIHSPRTHIYLLKTFFAVIISRVKLSRMHMFQKVCNALKFMNRRWNALEMGDKREKKDPI